MTALGNAPAQSPGTTPTVVPIVPFANPTAGLMLSMSICSAPTTTCVVERKPWNLEECIDLHCVGCSAKKRQMPRASLRSLGPHSVVMRCTARRPLLRPHAALVPTMFMDCPVSNSTRSSSVKAPRPKSQSKQSCQCFTVKVPALSAKHICAYAASFCCRWHRHNWKT